MRRRRRGRGGGEEEEVEKEVKETEEQLGGRAHPQGGDGGLALLALHIQLLVAPLPLAVLRLVEPPAGTRDPPHLDPHIHTHPHTHAHVRPKRHTNTHRFVGRNLRIILVSLLVVFNVTLLTGSYVCSDVGCLYVTLLTGFYVCSDVGRLYCNLRLTGCYLCGVGLLQCNLTDWLLPL